MCAVLGKYQLVGENQCSTKNLLAFALVVFRLPWLPLVCLHTLTTTSVVAQPEKVGLLSNAVPAFALKGNALSLLFVLHFSV